ncbi:methylisocitrate lyase [Kamptonema cortianum]|nr:methylisocitrate lyase [Geitlerinema splendidum]MDK3162174.1 methylisocitrate lyase [Kamptonema cortianum]
MLHPPLKQPGQILRSMWDKGIVVMPGAFSALSALAAYKQGAKAVYLSGGAITNNVTGMPDIALITLEEMSGTAARACQVAPVPIICDADTGFGEVWNVSRTVIEMERAGLAGIHLEDQVSPKRCGHLDGKDVIPTQQMVAKLRAASDSKRDSSFVLIARTDAAGVEGIDSAIERAKAYVDAGADAIFPEGLTSEEQFGHFREALPNMPLLANMTEFGKTPLISADRFNELGYQMVIFPVTALRVMLKAIEEFYADLLSSGTQAGWMEKMRTRQELYATIDYPQFENQDKAWSE